MEKEIYSDIIINDVALQLSITDKQVLSVLALLADKNTIPFIARYRQNETGGLDENVIFEINKLYEYQVNLKQRKEDVIRLIEEKGLLNDQIKQSIVQAVKIVEVDNIYQPYKDKKKTKASIAIDLGFEPLAMELLKIAHLNLEMAVNKYVTDEINYDMALGYALDIIAQNTCENQKVRAFVLDNIQRNVIINTKVKKKHDDEQAVFQMYYDYSEKLNKIANHRLLGINRAVNKKVVTLNFKLENDNNVENIYRYFCSKQSFKNEEIIKSAIEDGYKRLLFPSITRQLFSLKLEVASNDAIDVFAINLEKLLLTPPLKDKIILGFDPAFITGCKLAVIDRSGNLKKISVIYPHAPQRKESEAKREVIALIKEFNIDIIAIGNGTASRESEEFIAALISENKLDVAYAIVSEAGASVYSASKLAQQEFSDLSVEKRSAISIGRRLLDPLGELIKIDPKSIGVGQYQHDVNQKDLNAKLNFTLTKIINNIGVDLNTTSSYLLSNISGLSPKISENIIAYREEVKGYTNRKQLLKVKGLGPKAYEQAAGFLKVLESKELLDHTIIHPESYKLTYLILDKLNLDIKNLNTDTFKSTLANANGEDLSAILNVDIYTITYIVNALMNPNYDQRDTLDKPLLKKDILKLEDLYAGLNLQGVVRNVVDFGAFIDIGLKNDALLHISKITKQFIKHPSEKLSVNDIVEVKVESVDLHRKNVALTML